MLSVLSPAKKLIQPQSAIPGTTPPLLSEAVVLSKITAQLSRTQIQNMMHLSDNLTALTHARFADLDLADTAKGSPAILTFAGDVYRTLDAGTLSDDDLDFAGDHIRILSGLYGILRPLDQMQAYRLEMGRKIQTPRGEDLYDYWGSRIADQLRSDFGDTDAPLINLASNEYFKSVDQAALNHPVISPVFKEEKDGQQRILSIFAKQARGLMARWIIQNRIDHPDRLNEFEVAGYQYTREGSTKEKPLFVRPQPAKKAA